MSFTTYKGEKNISELVSRLYRLQGKGSHATAKQAADALLAANPHLEDFSKLALGSVLIIPDSGPPVVPSEIANQFISIRSAAVGRVQQAITAADRQLASVNSRSVDAIKSFVTLGKSPDLRNAAANNPDLKQVLTQMASATQDMLKDFDSAARAEPQKIASLSTAFSSLLKS